MNKTPQGDTEEWDWVPAEPLPTRASALGATALAASCLMVGVLIGILGGTAFQRSSATVVKTIPDVPNTAQANTPSSEPSLALGAAPDMPVKPLDKAPQIPVVINEGSAKPQESPREPDLRTPSAKAKAAEAEFPAVSFNTNAASTPERDQLVGKQKTFHARPAKPLSSVGSFKDYQALRNHVLGK